MGQTITIQNCSAPQSMAECFHTSTAWIVSLRCYRRPRGTHRMPGAP